MAPHKKWCLAAAGLDVGYIPEGLVALPVWARVEGFCRLPHQKWKRLSLLRWETGCFRGDGPAYPVSLDCCPVAPRPEICSRPRSPHTVTERSGGGARWDMTIRPWWGPGRTRAAAAQYVRGERCCAVLMIWLRWNRRSLPSGIQV